MYTVVLDRLLLTVKLLAYPLSLLVYLNWFHPAVCKLLTLSLLMGYMHSVLTVLHVCFELGDADLALDLGQSYQLQGAIICTVLYVPALLIDSILLYAPPLELEDKRRQVASVVVCLVAALCYLETCVRIHKHRGPGAALVVTNGCVSLVALLLICWSVVYPALPVPTAASLLVSTLVGTFVVTCVYNTCFPSTTNAALGVSCFVLACTLAVARYASNPLLEKTVGVLAIAFSCFMLAVNLVFVLYSTPPAPTRGALIESHV